MFLIMLGWFWYMTPDEAQLAAQREQRRIEDSLRIAAQTAEAPAEQPAAELMADPATTAAETGLPVGFASSATDTVLTTVRTPLYTYVFSSLGAGPVHMEPTEYTKWDGSPVQLIADSTRSAYSLEFVSNRNYNISTRNLLFAAEVPDSLVLAEGGTGTLRYVLEPEPGKRLVYTYTFDASTYEIGLSIAFEGIQDLMGERTFDFGWMSRLNSTEKSRASEATYKSGYVYSGDVLEQVILSDAGRDTKIFNGTTNWVSTKTKFFTQVIRPVEPADGAVITAQVDGTPTDELSVHHYTAAVRLKVSDSGTTDLRLYAGPLEYQALSAFEATAYDMVDVGYGWLNWFSKPFVKYLILPVINYLGEWLGNIGLAIIFFAALIKLLLHPLTKKSFESMAAMKELQPEMAALQEKYKNDPAKQQEATMKLFKKHKVNPLGGCLPNLLQIPVLVTLWRFFSNAIEIRGESFLWADDLSAPDVIIPLPIHIPLLGDHIAGFVLLMTASMVWQMKVSGQTGASANPQMKMFQYILPVMLLVMFNNFASGLSLYYLVFNLLSIWQQVHINRKMEAAKAKA